MASGAVAELRARGGRGSWRVAIDGPADGWADVLPGASVLTADTRGVLVALDAATDEQALLDAARAAGRVRHFALEEPTLAELFRGAVA